MGVCVCVVVVVAVVVVVVVTETLFFNFTAPCFYITVAECL